MRKIIALGIMLLFLGMTISSSTGLIVEKQSIKPLSSGNILYVGGSGPGNYSKIQDAIDNSSDGDTVYVYDDSSPYYENVIVNKSISLIGEDKNSTIIDGLYWSDVIYVSADWVNISGFTIQNSNSSWPHPAGVYTVSDNNRITGNNISCNHVGIYLYYSHNNSIIGNTIISNHKAGIELRDSINNNIAGNNISSNKWNGINLFGSINTITGNTISNNFCGIKLYSGNTTVTGNIISNNEYYGIYFDESGNNIITNNSFFNDGLWVSYSYHNNVENNTVNGKPHWM